MCKCECGKEFKNQLALNGHRSHCIVYVGEERYIYNHQLAIQKRKMMVEASVQKRLDAKVAKLNRWLSEQHTCEHCGKIMTEYYGSGRFCSKSCAKYRNHSEATKNKIRTSIINYLEQNDRTRNIRGSVVKHKEQKQIIPKKCKICGVDLGGKNKTGYCKDCIHIYNPVSDETRKKLSVINKRGRELGTIKSWTPRSNVSSNEVFWMKILDENNISYQHEFVVRKSDIGVQENGIYKLDFCIDGKIDLEIDSKIHRYPDRKEHDVIRDKRLSDAGYKVYRIKCYDKRYKDDINSVIDEFLTWYENYRRVEQR